VTSPTKHQHEVGVYAGLTDTGRIRLNFGNDDKPDTEAYKWDNVVAVKTEERNDKVIDMIERMVRLALVEQRKQFDEIVKDLKKDVKELKEEVKRFKRRSS